MHVNTWAMKFNKIVKVLSRKMPNFKPSTIKKDVYSLFQFIHPVVVYLHEGHVSTGCNLNMISLIKPLSNIGQFIPTC